MINHRQTWARLAQWLETSGPAARWGARLADGALALACWHLTYLFRLGFERWQPGRPWYDDYVSAGVVVVYLLCLEMFGVRQTLWRYFALDDARRMLWACLLAGLVSAVAVRMAELAGVARAVLLLHPVFTLLALTLSRMVLRMVWEHAQAIGSGDGVDRRYAIVVGGGETARRLLAGVNERHGWHVLMLLDDDPALHGMRIAGVPVRGAIDRLRDPSVTAQATHIIVALPEAQAEARQRALDLATHTGLEVLSVPSDRELRDENSALRPVAGEAAR